jgi:hypothetical protein
MPDKKDHPLGWSNFVRPAFLLRRLVKWIGSKELG